MTQETLDRFTDKYIISSESSYNGTPCWEWVAYKTDLGYGQFFINNKDTSAHRAAYQLYTGPVYLGSHIDHLCRNRGCVNPEHLEQVTPKENILRGESASALNKRKTKCVNNHPFDLENTRYDTNGNRYCGSCSALKEAKKRATYSSEDLLRISILNKEWRDKLTIEEKDKIRAKWREWYNNRDPDTVLRDQIRSRKTYEKKKERLAQNDAN